jgi:hypothetical protein
MGLATFAPRSLARLFEKPTDIRVFRSTSHTFQLISLYGIDTTEMTPKLSRPGDPISQLHSHTVSPSRSYSRSRSHPLSGERCWHFPPRPLRLSLRPTALLLGLVTQVHSSHACVFHLLFVHGFTIRTARVRSSVGSTAERVLVERSRAFLVLVSRYPLQRF